MPTNRKHIIATFTPQRMSEDKDYIYDIEGADREVEVTSKILSMPLREIHVLKDDQYNTDDLVEHEHDGPFRVEVVDSIIEFFDVDTLKNITQDMLDKTRKKWGADTAEEGKRIEAMA